MAGISDISGGAAGWGGLTPSGGLEQLAAAIAASPQVNMNEYIGWGLPAYPASGAHAAMPGSREGYEQYGLPPVIRQTSPFATAAYRTFVDPYGQMAVQPLVGFPSAYPHVLSGVAQGPMRVLPFINSMLPMWGAMMAPSQQPVQQPTAPASVPTGSSGTRPRVRQSAPASAPAQPRMSDLYAGTYAPPIQYGPRLDTSPAAPVTPPATFDPYGYVPLTSYNNASPSGVEPTLQDAQIAAGLLDLLSPSAPAESPERRAAIAAGLDDPYFSPVRGSYNGLLTGHAPSR